MDKKQTALLFVRSEAKVADTKPHFSKTYLVLDYNTKYIGGVAEWLKAPHSKCGMRATASGVRILSPPH